MRVEKEKGRQGEEGKRGVLFHFVTLFHASLSKGLAGAAVKPLYWDYLFPLYSLTICLVKPLYWDCLLPLHSLTIYLMSSTFWVRSFLTTGDLLL